MTRLIAFAPSSSSGGFLWQKDDWHGVWQAIENGRVNHSEGMAAFLCWLGIRLIEMRRILADDGSIYLHMDDTAAAYVKSLGGVVKTTRELKQDVPRFRVKSGMTAITGKP
ncbi:MAG: site-specific DNA-methyltransferase [Chloroflexi bacterium]|nr:site-specific DNA-methyltransferase [Chloroflexota bacterium]